ncbi:hypothetical protein VHEMI09944 [[Torrubiella] hemipterigena]|uniref:Uncharacterized protein n=1 Tax=[Torrubiella] hemipterigena TaxID=1531966 RepID=A0A0A1TR79_9HYPO|nr:hypothetical protein VHEMI09944 [[Torrubiella] hemipterigena]
MTAEANIKSAITAHATNAYTYAQTRLDAVIPPSTRGRTYAQTKSFATTRPVLFSLVAAQIAFAIIPLTAFATFVVCTVAFSFGAAVLSILFWISVSLFFLVPALLLSCVGALLVWAWAVGCFLAARALYSYVPADIQDQVQTRIAQAKDAIPAVKVEKQDFNGVKLTPHN